MCECVKGEGEGGVELLRMHEFDRGECGGCVSVCVKGEWRVMVELSC